MSYGCNWQLYILLYEYSIADSECKITIHKLVETVATNKKTVNMFEKSKPSMTNPDYFPFSGMGSPLAHGTDGMKAQSFEFEKLQELQMYGTNLSPSGRNAALGVSLLFVISVLSLVY